MVLDYGFLRGWACRLVFVDWGSWFRIFGCGFSLNWFFGFWVLFCFQDFSFFFSCSCFCLFLIRWVHFVCEFLQDSFLIGRYSAICFLILFYVCILEWWPDCVFLFFWTWVSLLGLLFQLGFGCVFVYIYIFTLSKETFWRDGCGCGCGVFENEMLNIHSKCS